jgi:antirestriction protein ArdC
MAAQTQPATFAELLRQAIAIPGRIHTAYTAFHGYSLGNRLLALVQCAERGIQPGPLATFPRWKELGRHVKKGEKAITLCQPVTIRKKTDDQDPDTETECFTRFIYRPHWFVLSQTDGNAYEAPTVSGWDKAIALAALSITEEPFAMVDGNCQGYAKGRAVAVSPVAALPFKTLFHEIAHVVLGHTSEAELSDGDRTPRSLREVEAEATAMLICASLELPGVEYSRGYIQHWNASGETIPERSAARIFKAADAILTAGRADADTRE